MKYSVEKGLIFADQRRRKKGWVIYSRHFHGCFSPPLPPSPPPLLGACVREHTRCVLAEPQFQMSLSFPTFIIRARMTGAHIISLSFSLATLGTHTRTRTRTLSLSLSLSRTQCGSYSKSRLLGIPFRRSKGEGEFFPGTSNCFFDYFALFPFFPHKPFSRSRRTDQFVWLDKQDDDICRSIQL